ncbi:hypothetical protein Scep_001054 [Stephania cephalantha]|uniref:Uncharacterized protein n=1 Tax=Stephania cephalantha TaxID=152367 RepID=A0AAP0Q3K9_9MAGN
MKTLARALRHPVIQQPLIEYITQDLFLNGVDIIWNPTIQKDEIRIFACQSLLWTREDANMLLTIWYLLQKPPIKIFINYSDLYRYANYVHNHLWRILRRSNMLLFVNTTIIKMQTHVKHIYQAHAP